MTISQGYQLATDGQFRELSNFSTPPRAGRITALEVSGQVRVDSDDPDGGDVLAWPLNGFHYAVDDVVYVAFAVNNPQSAIVIGSVNPLPVLDADALDGVFVRVDGTLPLTGDWDGGEDRAILLEKLKARDGEGLTISDDGGNLGIFVEDGGQVGIGTNGPVATLQVVQVQTAGEALRVARDLAAASTDSPVVLVLQDNSGDDQAALKVEQDGSGDILQLFDGATKRVYVVDGGALYQVVLAVASGREALAKFQISDAGDAALMFFNQTSANNGFIPAIGGMADGSTRPSLSFEGYVTAALDAGTAAIVRFDVLVTDAPADPPNGSFSAVGTRPLFAWANNGAVLMQMVVSGALFVGLSTGGASIFGVKAGSSNNDAAVGGVLYETRTQTGNVGAGEDDLASYSVPADTLSADGMSLRFEAWGTFAANANNKRVRARFGAAGTNQLFDTTAGAYSGLVWRLEGRVVRTGAATQRSIVEATIGANGGSVAATSYLERNASLNQTLSGAVTFKITGEGVSNNDIVIDGLILYWDDKNT